MRTFSLLLVALALAAACGDPLGLPAAAIPNRTDTVSLYALSGTPVTAPSVYIIGFRQVARSDQSATGFDFAFDIDTLGRPVLLPTGALGLPRGSGMQRTLHAFDSVTVAPGGSYQSDSALVVDSNGVMILHSRPLVCSFGITSIYYAKLHVLAIDTTSGPNGRRIDFEILNNVNCGYRGLEPGLPKR
jgi:hypothetical protein